MTKAEEEKLDRLFVELDEVKKDLKDVKNNQIIMEKQLAKQKGFVAGVLFVCSIVGWVLSLVGIKLLGWFK